MDVLKLIKTRKTTRRYSKKKVADSYLNKIIDAGIWGPSVLGIQSCYIVVIKSKNMINSIADIIAEESENLSFGKNILFSVTKILKSANIMLAIYNTAEASQRVVKIEKHYADIVGNAEKEAIAASIQNMLLVAESLGIGSCWLDMPLLCEGEINKALKIKGKKLIALITLGYSEKKSIRAPRKSKKNILKIFK